MNRRHSLLVAAQGVHIGANRTRRPVVLDVTYLVPGGDSGAGTDGELSTTCVESSPSRS